MATITGIAAWASVQKQKTGGMYGDSYCIDVLLDKDKAKELKAKGYNVKRTDNEIPGIEDSEGAYSITIREKDIDRKPKIVDAKKNPFHGLIGNGSKVTVVYSEFAYAGGKKIATYLKAVQVLELVEFAGAGGSALDELEETDGFVSLGSDAPIDMPESSNDFDDDVDF